MRIEQKRSFSPIAQTDCRVLILGTLPGDESLRQSQYYAHPQNRFWRMIASITNHELPTTYEGKLALLHQNRIGLWDVARQAERKGSLDSDIKREEPNNLSDFIESYHALRRVVFNGQKARILYARYFDYYPHLDYLCMPSTSPANAAFSLEQLCARWSEIIRLPEEVE